MFLAALVLLMLDALVVFWLSGGLSALRPRRRAAAAIVVAAGLAAAIGMSQQAWAQAAPASAAANCRRRPKPSR